MPGNEVRPPAGNRRAEEKTPDDGLSGPTVLASTDIESASSAYEVLLITTTGKYLRRCRVSFRSAAAAVHRATEKGQPAHVVLCKLKPVATDLELDRRWPV
jgi:hypothetical protein